MPQMIIILLILVFLFAAMWKVYVKAGQPGWGCLIPIYNTYLLCIIGGKPGWWVLLTLIPVINIVVSVLVSIGVAEQFGKGAGFGVGLWLLGMVFFPILAFGSATYGGPPPAQPGQ